jgi:hypothetical protein
MATLYYVILLDRHIVINILYMFRGIIFTNTVPLFFLTLLKDF